MTRPRPANLDRMRTYAGDLPRQFAHGFADGTELARSCQGAPDRATFVVGMGGSGIAGEFVRALVHRESPIHYECLHGPELPVAAGPSSQVILLSYSGDTLEVLRAADEAARRGARRIVVTSGGELRRRAEEDGDPLLLLPPDLPPRSAIGYSFGGLLGFLDGGFPESLEARVARTQPALAVYRNQIAGPKGMTRRVVERLGRRMPIIYGETALAAVAVRWATALEENAKRLAASDTLPEALHNAVVAWAAVPASVARRLSGIVLEWGGTSPQLHRAADFLSRTIERGAATVTRVPLPADDLLLALLEGIMLGDFVGLAVAERDAIDPLPIEATRRYRALVARSGRPARLRGEGRERRAGAAHGRAQTAKYSIASTRQGAEVA